MHSQSSRPDTRSCSNTNKLASNDSTATQIDDHENPHSQCPNHIDSSQYLRDHVRIATLQAEVELLESECDTLNDQVANLKADVENLEEVIASLETINQTKNVRHQQVINEYEQIIAEKNQAYQKLVEKPDNTKNPTNIWPVPMVRSLIQCVYEWLRQVLSSKY